VAGGWVESLARLGYAAKGVVYAIIGVLAVQAAFGTGGSTEGSRGAIRTIAQQPYGRVLLVVLAVSLLGYVIWRFAQSLFDAEGYGTDGAALIRRIGFAVSGSTYALLGVMAVRIAMGGGSGGGGSAKQAWTAKMLSQPMGPWLVGLVGVVIIGVGFYHFYRVYTESYMDSYKVGAMSQKERRLAHRAGQWGLSARGVTFVIIGIFFIQAARQHDPSEAQGLDAALSALASQPYGPWLLGAVAIGFVAYGVHSFVKARYRHFETG
jgi:hypothetical protein